MNNKILSFIFILFLAFSVQAQNVAYVNTEDILESLAEVKQANSDIEDLKAMFQKKGQEMVQELQMKYQELQQLQASGTLAPIEIDKRGAALKQEEEKLREFEQSSQLKLYKKSEELLGPIQEKVNKAIEDVATEEGYIYIFDAGTGGILYADKNIDVTKKVMDKLGIKTP
jgi:outer membrane protein